MSQLRDYRVIFPKGSTADRQYLTVEGNFFHVRSVRYLNSTGFQADTDLTVEFQFDGQGKIRRRAREGGKRNYSRVDFAIYNRGVLVDLTSSNADLEINIVLGEGELYNERDSGAIPDRFFTKQVSVGAGLGTNIDLESAFTDLGALSIYASAYEVRLCVPSTEANGLWIGGNTTNLATNGAWLEKGVTEWINFTGNLAVFNSGAASVKLTLAILPRRD
jgi:hypothetical protein